MIYAAFVILALLALTLVYVYFLRPAVMAPAAGERFQPPPARERFAEQARLVYVYMDGCGWCERFTPVWASFVDEYGERLALAGVAAERVEAADPRAEGLGVASFPTVLLVAPGRPAAKFEGERTVAGLADFCAEHGALPEGFLAATDDGERRRIGPPAVAPEGSAATIKGGVPDGEQAKRAENTIGEVSGDKGL